jgi:hypothetical protein
MTPHGVENDLTFPPPVRNRSMTIINTANDIDTWIWDVRMDVVFEGFKNS